ncbi:MAG TPA: hypothetical protein VFY54_16475, partial [Rubrobacter sp.]|nr:hypothetical protein [Rubrobacter sp.]
RLKLDSSSLSAGRGLAELPDIDDPDEAADMLKVLALRLFDRLEAETSRVQLLARTLRRSERVVWWPQAMSIPNLFGAASREEWLVRSARLLEDPRDIERIRRRARHPKAWWQLSYNLACYYAREGETEVAQQWLEIALGKPGSGQMADGWVAEDPDLERLHGSPRFEWVIAQVSTK